MVQAIINIDENTNRILNILKAKYGLKDKSQAIDIMAQQYEKELLEPELRPEYIKKMKKRQKEKTIEIKDFRKHFGLDKKV
ncbi:MAG: DUF2683 family protein [Euryarchaeota archaeon]|nr:DUF2683 family protein [Euryarchaeota archaeon]